MGTLEIIAAAAGILLALLKLLTKTKLIKANSLTEIAQNVLTILSKKEEPKEEKPEDS